MSRRQAKAQASSARAATGAFSSAFGGSVSPLSYVAEPPDLSSISDPNVVVYFRNLSKKDSTTKAKALEDIHGCISALQGPVEDAVLEAWIKVYPRTSIDNAKAVRQSAHSLQGQMATSAGKRMAKHMPQTVGAWLAGLYDTDRSVAEATQSSLRRVFSTAEKIQSLRRAYQKPILEFCRDAIVQESTFTLSDERTVSPDDAEAKYSRVVSFCLALLGSLLSNLQLPELNMLQPEYDNLVGSKKIWDFASHTDAAIRRSIHRFLKTCLSKQQGAVESNLETISKCYLSVALNSDQTGSAYDYVEALLQLSRAHPTTWTDHYASKTPIERRLRQFLKKGSQSGPREFWARLADLFKILPDAVLPDNRADAAELLATLHGGITKKDEPRFNLEAAMSAYLDIAGILCQKLPVEEQRAVLRERVSPMVAQYLRPGSEKLEWAIPSNSSGLLHQALAIGPMPSILEEEWLEYAQLFIDDIRTSQPEQSKDYERSQNALIDRATRLTYLQQLALNVKASTILQPVFTRACASIITDAIAVVTNRNGRPYGAAGTIAVLLEKSKAIVLADKEVVQLLEYFLQDDVPRLILSPSSIQLVDILYSMSDSAIFQGAWSACLTAALDADDSLVKRSTIEALITSSKIPSNFELTTPSLELHDYFKSSAQLALRGYLEWDSFTRLLQSPPQLISPSAIDETLSTLTQSLSLQEQALGALQGFRQIMRRDPSILKTFLSDSGISSLLQGLLLASESANDAIAQEAIAVNASVQTLLSSESNSKQSILEVIRYGLRDLSPASVSVETLFDLAKNLVQADTDVEQVSGVYPNLDDWDSSLAPFLDAPPKCSLAITNDFGGAIYLVHHRDLEFQTKNIPRDADGYSAAFRIAQYAMRIFQNGDLFQTQKLLQDNRAHYLRNIALTLQLADDNLGLAGANNLWAIYNAEVETDVMSFLSDAQAYIRRELSHQSQEWAGPQTSATLPSWSASLLSKIEPNTTAQAYYTARAYSVLVSGMIEVCGWNNSQIEDMRSHLKARWRDKETFPLIAFLNAFQEPLSVSNSCERICNELVADLTGLDIATEPEEGLRLIVLLNTLLYSQDGIAESIARQRLVFFVKHVILWLQDLVVASTTRAEVCRSLTSLLPVMSDIYGEHWGHIITSLAHSWREMTEAEGNPRMDSAIPYVHSSLKLYAQLRTLSQLDDPNDDLLDAWKETEQDVADRLINLLKHSQHFPDEFHQPLKIVNDVLSRQITKIPFKHLASSEELFPLLYVESQSVQQTAFDLLHKKIPTAQEQISINAVLEKTTARLPEELLSLILEPPTVAALGDASFKQTIPLPLRGYLLSWLLVFDHLKHASFKVKNEYIDHIKEGDYLSGLLNFTFDFLGHARSKPVDVSKLDVTSYNPDIEPPRRDTQWLLTHLYFLCLCHVPSLTKSWWIDCRSRPIVTTLEPWTEKYVSPPVISTALESVAEWSESQSTSEPDSPFSVKVSPRAREIIASYTVDEQTMAMRIALPAAFPLASASIEGINRVAVNEQKWQSWLRTSLGAITIFNGSLIDALTTFKRNVDGAIRGQTECAICYSIVGSDRKLPDKRCSTCKNLFHGTCLFKWFKTSGSSSCPLCRNPFNYG